MYRPMPIKVLFALAPGDRFVVDWSKDDDEEDHRLNHRTFTVSSCDGTTIHPAEDPGYEFCRGGRDDPDSNMVDSGRGYMYFYYPRDRS